MAASTISRATWTDDSGAGTDGTIINNARLQADVYDKVDALLAGSSPSVLTVGGRFRTDGAGFQALGNTAPAVSAAGDGGFYFDSSRKIWLQSMNASAYQPFVMTLDKTTTEQDVVSSTTETSVWSFTVKGGLLGTAGCLRLTLWGSYLNNTGSSQNLFVAVKYGGTVIAGANSSGTAFGGGNYATDASRHSFLLQTWLSANGATNSQRSVTRGAMGAPQATELQWGNTINNDHQVMHSSIAVDSTADQTFTVTVQHGANNASLSFKRFAAVLELIG